MKHFSILNNLGRLVASGIAVAVLGLISTPAAACTGGSNSGTITMTGAWQTQSVTNGQYYEFQGEAGEVYYFSFCGNGGGATWDTQLSILNSGGSQVAYNDDYCGLRSYIAWTCTANGTYRILTSEYYCNNAGGYSGTMAFYGPQPCPANAPYTPIISADTISGACGDDSVSVSANTSYSSWSWSNGATGSSAAAYAGGEMVVEATDGSGCSYNDTVLISLINPTIAPQDTLICEGETVELDAYATGGTCIQVEEFLESNYAVTDHNSYSGDDRGGIAITQDYLYYVGDGNTVRMNASNLGSPSSLPRRDGIFSDLGTGQLYTFWSTTYGDFYSGGPYNSIDAIRMMDASLNYGTTINLSQTISSGSTSFIAAGNGYVILWANNNDTFYHIELSSGTVTTLGTGNMTNTSTIYYYPTENWSRWGIAECDGGEYSIVGRAYYWNGSYVYSPGSMVRYNISTTATELVNQFTSAPSDMACVTYSPWNNRWYFHYEGSGVFGGSSETAGYADISASGAAGGSLNFVWDTGDSTQRIDLTPSQTDTYVVTVYDGVNSCEDSTMVYVSEAPDISFSATDIACNGDSTGAVASTVTNGQAPYSYFWFNGDSAAVLPGNGTATLTDLPAGWYLLHVTDSNGCSSMDTAEVAQPLVPFTPILANVTDLNCFGDNSGSGTVLPAGGDGPYSYAWSNGGTAASDASLSAGIVMVTVTDANGCERVLTDSLDQPDEFFANLGMTGTTCSGDEDGTASSNAVGGTMPYSYSWASGGSGSSVTGISSGYQNLTVTDANGCMYVDSVDVTFQFASPVVPLGPVDTMCNGFTYVLDAGTDGSMYEWSTGDTSQTLTIIASGIYDVTVTNNDGCETEATTLVTKITCPTGIANVRGEEIIVSLYPNPTDGIINLEVKGDMNNSIDLSILDLSGRVVWNKAGAIMPNSLQTIDLSNQAAGTYFLRMIRENQVVNVTPVTIK